MQWGINTLKYFRGKAPWRRYKRYPLLFITYIKLNTTVNYANASGLDSLFARRMRFAVEQASSNQEIVRLALYVMALWVLTDS